MVSPSKKHLIETELTPREAIAEQVRLRGEVKLIPLVAPPKIVGGADMSMNMFATEGCAGFVTLSYPELIPLSHNVEKSPIRFPYIPGLLSFREIPMLLKAWEALNPKPDVLLVDGVGIAHPRRLGIATHLGLILGIPTIGCAKSVLVGSYEEPGIEAGSLSYLYDKKEIVGAALRTKRKVKPMFISPGHLITLEESIEIVKNCVRQHRLPEPTRLAHTMVNGYRMASKIKDSPAS